MDKLAAMRAFVEIVDRGSLSAAARSLDRSLPTLVRTLAQLERSLGRVLLRRTTRRMSLTDEGRVYLERCRQILADVEEAEALVGSGSGELRGRLRVTAPTLFGQMHVAPAVVGFVRQHPAVEVELLLLDRIVDLVDESIDAALRIAALRDSTLVASSVGEVRRVVCASPGLIAAHGRPERPEELADRPCVRFRGLVAGNRWTFREGGRPLAVDVSGAFTTNDARAAVEACTEGLGYGFFLSYQVEPALRAGRLAIVLETFEPPPTPVSVVHVGSRLLSPRLRAFIDWLKRSLRERAEGVRSPTTSDGDESALEPEG